ncbi:metallophosphoesterase family protein [Arcticibacterium luteifluviistationis]|uniref:YfcE family phosphodiesterase n=1 Tax=Arcticibacterium luteifluviistationis TaxID=1784714 RepID=A0A2Z4GAM8_9BACT|nr:metallophosphoesterase family protein [Arcticibacterium luteifluviistationis]AWV98257.1 YfcE family phosphodiesterase [Arcticibacterium luteifluviistationis]
MKIAFFSDIHANLPALEAFFKDVESENVDAIYCLGDLVGYNVWPNEVVNEIRKRHIPTIMGNHDEALLKPISDDGKPSNKGLTSTMVSDENRDYLINLPRNLTLNFVTNDEPFNLLMVHGSVKAINDYMVVDYPEEEVVSMMEFHRADVLLCGHTHKPFHRIIEDGNTFKHVVNIGSVGKPKDGDPRACYAILELNQSTSPKLDTLKVSFKRVEYDVEKAAKAVEQSEFDHAFAEALRIAKY